MKNVTSSFRDPSGHLFWQNGVLYRTVTGGYANTYDAVKRSGLFDELTAERKIVAFKEVSSDNFPNLSESVSFVLAPEVLPFVSYPYEWSFSQLKDAALLTLDLHICGMERGFLLKDASAYNVQFLNGKPVFIDHLSFDLFDKYPIWPAYGQFCRHFLAPLVLVSKVDPGMQSLLKNYMDGIPLPLARKLVPARKLIDFGLFVHFLCHANSQKKYADKPEALKNPKKMSVSQMLDFAISLKDTVTKLKWRSEETEWAEYYKDTNYSDNALRSKIELVSNFVRQIPIANMVWDFGGNTGFVSRAIQEHAEHIVCFDIDAGAVERNYLAVKANNETKILPLVMDFANPSPSIGFASTERMSLQNRGKADVGMALALVHHLAISNNIPLGYLAKYFSKLCRFLIVEFVPREDSQVQRLLLSREDIFDAYTCENFLEEFSAHFDILGRENVADSKRSVFLMKSSHGKDCSGHAH